MKCSSLTIVSLVTLGLLGAFAIGQVPVPADPAVQPGMHAGHMMGGDMKGMMDKMPPEMKMRCQMVMNTAVTPSDPAAILALKDQLKLTEAQATQLDAINKEARDKAAAVLTVEQTKTLAAMPQTPQTMKDMHEQMMGHMQKMMGGKMGDQPMSCPMMQMMKDQTGPTTLPKAGASAAPAEQHHMAPQ